MICSSHKILEDFKLKKKKELTYNNYNYYLR